MVTPPPEECPREVPQAEAPQTPQLGGVGPRWLSHLVLCRTSAYWLQRMRGPRTCTEVLYELRIPHSAEFLGVHFKKRRKVLKHSLQRGSFKGAAEDRGMVFSP